jgi:hypothetical protein
MSTARVVLCLIETIWILVIDLWGPWGNIGAEHIHTQVRVRSSTHEITHAEAVLTQASLN